jgi:hypothetical protein
VVADEVVARARGELLLVPQDVGVGAGRHHPAALGPRRPVDCRPQPVELVTKLAEGGADRRGEVLATVS